MVGYRGRLNDDERRELQRAYRSTVGSVYAFFAYSVDATTAEDLTAATFERVVRSWRRFDASKGRFESWVLAIARNILRDHLRRQSYRAGPSLDEFPALAASLATNDDSPWDRLDVIALIDWLNELQPREREVLGLRYGADLSSAEIGRCLGLTPDNVNQISSRALRRLRAIAAAEPRVSSNGHGNGNVSVNGNGNGNGNGNRNGNVNVDRNGVPGAVSARSGT